MAPAPSKHAPTAPGAVPWPDEVIFHVDVGSELHARLAIKPLVALLGTARGGQLACLTYAHEHGCPWNMITCEAAARGGQLACLTYAHEHGCPWSMMTCQEAARGGRLGCLTYAREHGCPWDEGTCTAAAGDGHLGCSRLQPGPHRRLVGRTGRPFLP